MASVRLLPRRLLAPDSIGSLCRVACARIELPTLWRAKSQLATDFTPCVSLKNVRHEHSGDEAPQQSKGADQLLQYWHGLLSSGEHQGTAKASPAKASWDTKDLQDLLHAAIRVRHGRVSGVLPEQLLATFMQVYRKTMGPEDRRRLFLLVCQDFGVQGQHACTPTGLCSCSHSSCAL